MLCLLNWCHYLLRRVFRKFSHEGTCAIFLLLTFRTPFRFSTNISIFKLISRSGLSTLSIFTVAGFPSLDSAFSTVSDNSPNYTMIHLLANFWFAGRKHCNICRDHFGNEMSMLDQAYELECHPSEDITTLSVLKIEKCTTRRWNSPQESILTQ